MLKTLTFIRHNAIALLALFVALGGTSYAALSLPAGSVGSKQLATARHEPESITPYSPAGSQVRSPAIRCWARVSAEARLIASSPRATVLVVQSPAGSPAVSTAGRHARAIAIPRERRAPSTRQCERGHGGPDGQGRSAQIRSVSTFDASGNNVPVIVNIRRSICP